MLFAARPLSFQMLSLIEAQAQFFQQGNQSLSELDEYRRQLNEEVIACFALLQLYVGRRGAEFMGTRS